MRIAVVLILITVCLTGTAFSQNNASLQASKSDLGYVIDSLRLESSKRWVADSVYIVQWGDSLRIKVSSKFNRDSLEFLSKIDSLKAAGRPYENYSRKLDSLVEKKDALLTEVSSKQSELLAKTSQRLATWREQVKAKIGRDPLEKVADLEGSVARAAALDEIKIGDGALSNLQIPEIPQLDIPDISELNLSDDLASLNKSFSFDQLNGLKGVQDKIGAAGESISDFTQVINDPDKVLEESVTQISEVKSVTEMLDGAEVIQNNEVLQQVQNLNTAEAVKAEIKEQVLKRSVNHFAGKEEVLQEAMNKLAKYKSKYSSLSSLTDIKNLPKNAMHGKPFRERIYPGVAFQFQKRDDALLLDINPYWSYRITGKLTGGAGWNQRISYSRKFDHVTSVSDVYGPRIFAEFRTWRGFSARLEAEWMKTSVPPLFNKASYDPRNREWVFTPLMGIKKEYRFFRTIKGTAHLMFNLYNPLHKSPYGDLIYSRFGFEFPFKAKTN